MLLPLIMGCGRILEVRVVTKMATPAPSTPTLTPGITVETATAPSPTPASVVATPESPTSTPEPPTAMPEPPTSTPTAEPEATRIQFKPGVTSATVTGRVDQNGVERYVLRALSGQTMEVSITSPHNDVGLSIWGADGTVLERYVEERAYWRGELPSTQDYFIEAVSVGKETSYELTVIIRPRIQFGPGATSATVTGSVERNGVGHYVLRAFAGQMMEVIITSPNSDVLLTIWGADGVPLKRYVDDMAEWQGELYSTQDYFIEAVSVGEATTYTLTVTLSALSLPEPTRIQFEPGATSATREGSVEPGMPDRYVLRALRGQRMEVRVSPAAAVDMAVEGQDGSFWSVPSWEGTLTIGELPATQDYIVTLATVPSAGTTSYTMEVSVAPP